VLYRTENVNKSFSSNQSINLTLPQNIPPGSLDDLSCCNPPLLFCSTGLALPVFLLFYLYILASGKQQL
jgi:hypothetical protein